ncbi:MAG: hypothetical protein Kow0092_08010 [Deferrisomatales bacterium]
MSQTARPFPNTDPRASPRSPIPVTEARSIAGMDVFFGYALNISRGGAFIATTKYRQPGEEYRIRFRLPGLDRPPFCCQARVVWVRRYHHGCHMAAGFGLRFLDLAEADARAIDEWVRSVAAR